MDNLNNISAISAVVEHDYKAKEPGELDLIKGAIINNIKIQSGGWWEGSLAVNGKIGLFPDNFVKLLDSEDKSPVILRDKSATLHRKCKVVYSYTQINDDELSLAVGNIIDVLGEVEEGWWRGKLGDKIGVFPSNFVVPIETSPILANKRPNSMKNNNRSSLNNSREDIVCSSSPPNIDKDAPVLPPKPIKEYCKVLYPYNPENEDELELHIGDIITIISKDLPDKGWWRGDLKGKIGVFPDNFVTILHSEVSPTKDGTHFDKSHNTSKVFIKKSNNGSSTNRKDSFGSRDSLNDILNETGIISGNVAAQRKSLENKTIDITTTNDLKAVRRSLENKTSEVRKSLENIEEKKTPPPVLTKKPIVPVKKSTSVTSVAGSIFSGLKQKVKSVEQKLSSHDSMDGIGSSKQNSQIADNHEKGVTIEKIKKEEMDFDNVERSSILPDMRAGRAKAPKRRPPSININISNNNEIYLNGSLSYQENSELEQQTEFIEQDELAKPKPREWEKKKAPWMEELKANQAKKTTNEIRTNLDNKNEQDLSSKIINETDELNKLTNVVNYPTNIRKSTELISNINFDTKQTNDNIKKETSDIIKISSNVLTNKFLTNSEVKDSSHIDDNIKIRPTSLSIRNRSISPVGHISQTQIKSNPITPINYENVCVRVVDLEQRIIKLENIVQTQNKVIEDLVRLLKDETNNVKDLKNQLDKYAQCVTQV